jgi:tRNA 2-thiouridine synthesizing protein A
VIELDYRGKRCPLPVIGLARAVLEVPVGEMVRVVADDPAAAVDIAAWCRLRGHELAGTGTEPDGAPWYDVRRVAQSSRSGER